jgi:integrating conjugative element protein (TIGR03761 family)
MMQEPRPDDKRPILPFKQKPVFSRLEVNGEITLHTRIAQSLFHYSWQPGKLGLLQFAKTMTTVWYAARQGDPYAEWYLLKTYDALFYAREKIKQAEQKLEQYFADSRGIKINLPVSNHPVCYPLRFSTPFGFMGAALLANMDYVFRQILTLERMGIAVGDRAYSVPSITGYMQKAFAVPRQWQRTGVTRQGIHEHSASYQKAKALLGELPEAVLKNEIDFLFFPGKKKDPAPC